MARQLKIQLSVNDPGQLKLGYGGVTWFIGLVSGQPHWETTIADHEFSSADYQPIITFKTEDQHDT